MEDELLQTWLHATRELVKIRLGLANISWTLAVIMSWVTPYPWYTDLVIGFVIFWGNGVNVEMERRRRL